MNMRPATLARMFASDYLSEIIGNTLIVHADCFEWLDCIPENSLHAIVPDMFNGTSIGDTGFRVEVFDSKLHKLTGSEFGIFFQN